MSEKVAIIGYGSIDSLGETTNKSWIKIRQGISETTLFDNAGLDVLKVRKVHKVHEIPNTILNNKDWNNCNIVTKLGIHSVSQALGMIRKIDVSKTGLLFSTLGSDKPAEEEIINNLRNNKRSFPRKILGSTRGGILGTISNLFGLGGISLSLMSDCTTGLMSMDYAIRLLQSRDEDYMIVGCADAMTDLLDMYAFQSYGALSMSDNNGCKSFDKNRSGFMMGDGCGVVVLQRLEDAINENNTVYGVVDGISYITDSTQVTRLGSIAPERCMQKAIDKAGMMANDIDFISCHGTGTIDGDEEELSGIERIFGNKYVISSIKPHIGHTMSACGIIEIIYGLKSLEDGIVPEIINCEDPISVNVKNTLTETPKTFLKNSFAFGGKCASGIFSL